LRESDSKGPIYLITFPINIYSVESNLIGVLTTIEHPLAGDGIKMKTVIKTAEIMISNFIPISHVLDLN
jgi:hypothetical protein